MLTCLDALREGADVLGAPSPINAEACARLAERLEEAFDRKQVIIGRIDDADHLGSVKLIDTNCVNVDVVRVDKQGREQGGAMSIAARLFSISATVPAAV